LIVSVQTGAEVSLEQIRAILESTAGVAFEGRDRQQVYAWVETTLRQQRWSELKRGNRGLVRRYLEKLTGRSRAQVTRLIQRYEAGDAVAPKPYLRHRFPTHYTRADIVLLATVDEAHENLSGPATQKILQREFNQFGDVRYERLAQLSVAQLYRLRKSRVYRQRRVIYRPTHATQVGIGERRAPQPQGRPGYLRVDTVHHGDLDGVKGVYHINAVDEVTQWQVVGCVPQISEAHLLPVLEALLAQFPFQIRGFHSDNGSEYINHTVAALLGKLLIEQTKSRPRHSNDNGLAECKNGAVIRKHMGYGHIAAEHARAIHTFYQQQLNPYLNFHRPCGVPECVADRKGKLKRTYKRYATPCELVCELAGVTFTANHSVDSLQRQARACSDTEAAAAMQQAKRKLFTMFQPRRTA
jgi:hypothetical protein